MFQSSTIAPLFLFWHAIQARVGREVILPFSN